MTSNKKGYHHGSQIPLNVKGKGTQFARIIEDFRQPKTMMMVDKDTGIMRSSVCPNVDAALKQGLLRLIKKAPCEITGYKAGYYSSNPDDWKDCEDSRQLSFDFDAGEGVQA